MDNKTISSEKIKLLLNEMFNRLNFVDKDTQIISDVLIAAEMRGIPSHGISRIPDYYALIKSGRIKTNPQKKIIHETPSTAVVDGDSCMGMVAGQFAMNLAIEKAKNVGTGWVAVCNSNHFGIAGYYAMMALEHDMTGFAFTNANPLVCPAQSISRMLGTNPIAFAVPAGKYPPFIADFATTPIARGKLALSEKKGEKIPFGFVQDKDGFPSEDPGILKQGGGMLPLGSDLLHGSHKGYCLGAMVDILSSVFSGANFGPFVPPSVSYLPVLKDAKGKGTGHFFGAMRIDAFRPAEDFKSSMDEWIDTFKKSKPSTDFNEVLIPGEPERRNEEYHKKNGIYILPTLMEELKEICKDLKIDIFAYYK